MRATTAQLLARLDEYRGEPAWWAADVRRLVDSFRDSAARGRFAVPVDRRTGEDSSSALARLQRAIGGYGHLLAHWHDLVAAATDLRARGVTPTLAVK